VKRRRFFPEIDSRKIGKRVAGEERETSADGKELRIIPETRIGERTMRWPVLLFSSLIHSCLSM
jgi:hypothetical protein